MDTWIPMAGFKWSYALPDLLVKLMSSIKSFLGVSPIIPIKKRGTQQIYCECPFDHGYIRISTTISSFPDQSVCVIGCARQNLEQLQPVRGVSSIGCSFLVLVHVAFIVDSLQVLYQFFRRLAQFLDIIAQCRRSFIGSQFVGGGSSGYCNVIQVLDET